jgi:hypothetical protein
MSNLKISVITVVKNDTRGFEKTARGIEWILDHLALDKLSQNARQKVLDNFEARKVAAQYLEMYETMGQEHNIMNCQKVSAKTAEGGVLR